MRLFLILLALGAMSEAKAADPTNCQNFVASDPELNRVIALKPDCTLDRNALATTKQNNPGLKIQNALSSLTDGQNSDDKVMFSDGATTKVITLKKQDGKLSQLEVSSFSGTKESNPLVNKREVYTFDCSSGSCTPKTGVEETSSHKGVDSPTFQRQLFDVDLCKKLKAFFAANPMAAAGSGAYEEQSAKLLKDYQATRLTYYGQTAGKTAPTYSGAVSTGGVSATTNKNLDDKLFKAPGDADAKEALHSKLAVALSLNKSCESDSRLSSSISEKPSSTTPPANATGKASH